MILVIEGWLLVHSMHDAALVAQLEGDLLAAFGDDKAVDAYERALQAYLATERAVHARILYGYISTAISPVMARQYARALDGQKVLPEANLAVLPVESTTEACI